MAKGRANKNDQPELRVLVTAQRMERITVEIAAVDGSTLLLHNPRQGIEKMVEEQSRPKPSPTKLQPRKQKKPRDFDAECEAFKYRIDGNGRCGFPAVMIKKAMLDALTLAAGLPKTTLSVTLWVRGNAREVGTNRALIEILGAAPQPKTDLVKLSDRAGTRMPTTRPEWLDWWARIPIDYDPDILTPEAVTNLVNRAGRYGIGEKRPSSPRNKAHDHGMFEVVADDDPRKK